MNEDTIKNSIGINKTPTKFIIYEIKSSMAIITAPVIVIATPINSVFILQ